MPILPLTLAAVAPPLTLILVVRLHAAIAVGDHQHGARTRGRHESARRAGVHPERFRRSAGLHRLVLGLGAIIGAYIESSGGGRVLADWLLEKFGRTGRLGSAAVASFLVGLPLFFEVAFIVLIPVIWSLTKESKKSLLFFGMPMATAMTVAHAHGAACIPEPPRRCSCSARISERRCSTASRSRIPMIIVGGIIYGRWIARRMFIPLPAFADQPEIMQDGKPPAVGLVILLLILPVLMIAATFLDRQEQIVQFFGHPFTALTVTALGVDDFPGRHARAQSHEDCQTGHRFASADRQPAVHHGRRRRTETDHRGHRRRRRHGETAGVVARFAAAGGLSHVRTDAPGAGFGHGGDSHLCGDHRSPWRRSRSDIGPR